MEASDTAAAVRPHAGIRRANAGPTRKLVLPIASTVFGALLIRRLLHRPGFPPGSERSGSEPRERLIAGNVDAHTAFAWIADKPPPTVLGDQLGKIG
jgi:hypothetical protein